MRYILLPFLLCLLAPLGYGQTAADSTPVADGPFAGQTVGIYLSRKGFSFSSEYYLRFAHFAQAEDSLGLAYEDLKLALLVKLGFYLEGFVQGPLGAEKAYFANSYPELAGSLVQHAGNPSAGAADIKNRALTGTDYIVLLDSMQFSVTPRTSVYSYSNQVYSERRVVDLAQVHARILHLPSGRLVHSQVLDFDVDKTPEQQYFRPIKQAQSPGEAILLRVLNALFYEVQRAVP